LRRSRVQPPCADRVSLDAMLEVCFPNLTLLTLLVDGNIQMQDHCICECYLRASVRVISKTFYKLVWNRTSTTSLAGPQGELLSSHILNQHYWATRRFEIGTCVFQWVQWYIITIGLLCFWVIYKKSMYCQPLYAIPPALD
jgi:hypothetical protein